jgi:hypothetical protein
MGESIGSAPRWLAEHVLDKRAEMDGPVASTCSSATIIGGEQYQAWTLALQTSWVGLWWDSEFHKWCGRERPTSGTAVLGVPRFELGGEVV